MGSCTSVGLFMDFWITRYDEVDEKTCELLTSYRAEEVGGDYDYRATNLESLILQVIRHSYLNNNYYECFITSGFKDLEKEMKERR